MAKAREQKKFEGEINFEHPYVGWDPLGRANLCLQDLKKDIERCDSSSTIAHTGCIFGNAEAAFYEDLINEEEMISLKEDAVGLRHQFSSKCKCDPRR